MVKILSSIRVWIDLLCKHPSWLYTSEDDTRNSIQKSWPQTTCFIKLPIPICKDIILKVFQKFIFSAKGENSRIVSVETILGNIAQWVTAQIMHWNCKRMKIIILHSLNNKWEDILKRLWNSYLWPPTYNGEGFITRFMMYGVWMGISLSFLCDIRTEK